MSKSGPNGHTRKVKQTATEGSSAQKSSSVPSQHAPTKKVRSDGKEWTRRGTAKQIRTILAHSIEEHPDQVDSVSSHEFLCAYNWRLTVQPSIYVPGAPPTWTHPTLPMTLPKDRGRYFIDQNASKSPTSTFEPMFRALDIMQPDYTFDQVDIVVNRNSLRKLLGFVAGHVSDTFRIDLSMVHNTLIMTRRERNVQELIRGLKNSGHGHEFERHCTTSAAGLEDSTSHHRIIRYHLGSLNCVVRYEVDASMDEPDTSTESSLVEVEASSKGEDNIVEALQTLSIHEKNDQRNKPRQTEVIQLGRSQTSPCLIELKAKKKKPPKKEVLPQLWFGRVPYLAVGIHTDGVFREIVVENMAEKYLEWESQRQADLRKLVKLLEELVMTVRSGKHKSCVAVCNHKVKPPVLEIYESTNKQPVLPRQIIERRWTGAATNAETTVNKTS